MSTKYRSVAKPYQYPECSADTPRKHALMRQLIRDHIAYFKKHAAGTYTFVDLNAGPYYYDRPEGGSNKSKCSSMIFVEEALAAKIEFNAHLVDADPHIFGLLNSNIASTHRRLFGVYVHTYCLDNLTFVNSSKVMFAMKPPCGLVIADPIGVGDNEFNAISKLGVFPGLDFIMNVNLNAIARLRVNPRVKHLNHTVRDYIDRIPRRHKLFDPPAGSRRFSMMVASDNGYIKYAESLGFKKAIAA